MIALFFSILGAAGSVFLVWGLACAIGDREPSHIRRQARRERREHGAPR